MNEVADTVDQINSFLRQLPWCDFEVFEFSGYRLIIQGSLSTTYPFDIRITFDEVFFIQCNADWHTDTSKNVFQIAKEEDAKDLNARYRVEEGNTIFQFIPEDSQGPFYIIAKKISWVTADKYKESNSTTN